MREQTNKPVTMRLAADCRGNKKSKRMAERKREREKGVDERGERKKIEGKQLDSFHCIEDDDNELFYTIDSWRKLRKIR